METFCVFIVLFILFENWSPSTYIVFEILENIPVKRTESGWFIEDYMKTPRVPVSGALCWFCSLSLHSVHSWALRARSEDHFLYRNQIKSLQSVAKWPQRNARPSLHQSLISLSRRRAFYMFVPRSPLFHNLPVLPAVLSSLPLPPHGLYSTLSPSLPPAGWQTYTMWGSAIWACINFTAE